MGHRDLVRPIVQAIILTVLCACTFRSEFYKITEQATTMAEAGHTLALPVMVALLVFARRDAIRKDIRRGSAWGPLLVAVAVLGYAATTWPFYFGYARRLQFVVAAAGILLTVGGWRVLWRCAPIVIIVFVAMPIGWNSFSTFVIRPETITLDIAAKSLSLLPSVFVELHGSDLHYHSSFTDGIIALGDPHRGVVIPFAYLTILIFVTYSRVRPLWQIFALGVLMFPMVLVANLSRLLLHGVLTIYGQAAPLDAWPRNVSMAAAMVLAYLIMVLCAFVLENLVVADDDGLPSELTEDDAA
ncbi:MAG: archaeosortase/exosortase family protein [Phycisphaerales bacterium]|nr:archaeosortase/exosortase family protein [Phycisphaerales bacterium]